MRTHARRLRAAPTGLGGHVELHGAQAKGRCPSVVTWIVTRIGRAIVQGDGRAALVAGGRRAFGSWALNRDTATRVRFVCACGDLDAGGLCVHASTATRIRVVCARIRRLGYEWFVCAYGDSDTSSLCAHTATRIRVVCARIRRLGYE